MKAADVKVGQVLGWKGRKWWSPSPVEVIETGVESARVLGGSGRRVVDFKGTRVKFLSDVAGAHSGRPIKCKGETEVVKNRELVGVWDDLNRDERRRKIHREASDEIKRVSNRAASELTEIWNGRLLTHLPLDEAPRARASLSASRVDLNVEGAAELIGAARGADDLIEAALSEIRERAAERDHEIAEIKRKRDEELTDLQTDDEGNTE